MPSIFGHELRARFGGYRPSSIDHARAHRTREGNCLCGLSVACHFTPDNHKLSCENARARVEQSLEERHRAARQTAPPYVVREQLMAATRAIGNPQQRPTCDVCRGEIPADAPLPALPDGSVACSTTCELNWYEARR